MNAFYGHCLCHLARPFPAVTVPMCKTTGRFDVPESTASRAQIGVTYAIAGQSVALDVHELLQDVLDLDQITRVLHHFVDVLVCGWDFVEQHFGMPILDACHCPGQVLHAEERPRFGS